MSNYSDAEDLLDSAQQMEDDHAQCLEIIGLAIGHALLAVADAIGHSSEGAVDAY